jgi:nucleoside 2-deoxyribosyltransferase
MKDKPYVYLAGPIRGVEDYVWRKQFVDRFNDSFNYLIPSDIVLKDGITNPTAIDKLRNFKPLGYMTYRTDLDMIQRSDMVVMNLLPMETGYPAMGTLFELGYARALNKFIVIIAPQKQREHPFIAFGGDGVYRDFETAYEFLERYTNVLEGNCPVFDHVRCV